MGPACRDRAADDRAGRAALPDHPDLARGPRPRPDDGAATTGCSAGRRGRSSTTCLPVHHATELRGEPVHYALRGAEVYVGALNFELLQPLEGPNLWSELIDRRGEGIASIATMFHERADGDAVKREFLARYGIPVSMKADIGDHIEYYYLDTEARFGCLIESGSGHAIDFVRPAPGLPVRGRRLRSVAADRADLPDHPGLARRPRPRRPGGRLRGGVRLGPVGTVRRPLRAAVRGAGSAVSRSTASPSASPRPGSTTSTSSSSSRSAGPSPWRAFLDANGEGIAAIAVTFATAGEVARLQAAFADLGIGVLASAGRGPAGRVAAVRQRGAVQVPHRLGDGSRLDR